MSEDQDDGISSAGMSDGGEGSLVGFGEAASTTSGPISSTSRTPVGFGGGAMAREGSGYGSPSVGQQRQSYAPADRGSPMQGIQAEKARNLDGMTYDSEHLDTASTGGRSVQGRNANMTGQETSDRIVRERLGGSER